MGLYLLIWGEAANVRFMPECLCYIFHNVSIIFFCLIRFSGIVHNECLPTSGYQIINLFLIKACRRWDKMRFLVFFFAF